MFTRVKTADEIEAIRVSGKMLAAVLNKLEKFAGPGMTSKDAAMFAAKELKSLGGTPSFLNYCGFPDIICISINDEIVHGIPGKYEFKLGDIVSFDFGVTYKKMITDAAFSMVIGGALATTPEVSRLLKTTEQSLYSGIEVLKSGVRVGDIGSAIQKTLSREKLGIIRDLVGHGVGHEVHEDPNIPNYGVRGTGPILKAGMTIAIEPMATLGGHGIKVDRDKWTIRTKDGSLSAHFEHTILITQDGYEILTDLTNL